MKKNKHHKRDDEQDLEVENSDAQAVEQKSDIVKVKMIFSQDKFYNDLNNPIFLKGKVYELEGADWIQRWEKRGGQIIDENVAAPLSDKEEKLEETKPHEANPAETKE